MKWVKYEDLDIAIARLQKYEVGVEDVVIYEDIIDMLHWLETHEGELKE